MEKQTKAKNNLILKFLPKVASPVTFQNLPFSPRKDKRSDYCNAKNYKLKTQLGKGFSGPIVSIIPAEALQKSKNSSFSAQEPTSPKISCMGQIKHKKKINKQKHVSMPKDFKPFSSSNEVKKKKKKKKKKSSKIRNIFSSEKQAGRKSDVSDDKSKVVAKSPGLNKMRKFTSSRDTFANFDWKLEQIAPEDYYSDEDRGERENSDGEGETIIPFSAPIFVDNKGLTGVTLEPRKEINIWKKRSMAQPTPLQVNTMVDISN